MGLSLTGLAEKATLKTATQIKEIEDGKNANPSLSTLQKLAGALELPLAELLGELPFPAGKEHDAPRAESTIPLPLVGVAAGGPPIAFEEIPGEEFSVLRHLYRRGRYVIKIVGESMEPTFWSQDLLLVEPVAKAKDGTIAVVLVKGESTVKRVHRLKNGGFILESDNRHYPPIEADAEDVEIKGKVLRIVDGVRP
jgi:phage repressor protein C with HTH and peptisase S24 domain